MLHNILNKLAMSEISNEALWFLHKHLKLGCFCVDDGRKSLAVLENIISRFINLRGFNISDHDSDFLLMCCSLLEELCRLFTIHHSSGYMCSSLLDLIHFLLYNCQVAEHLIPFLFCERRFVTFAATKALIGLLKAECLSSGNSLCVGQFCKEWTSGLLPLDKTMINRVNCMEQLFLAFKNFSNESMTLCRHQKCKSVKVDHHRIEQFDEMLICCMLQSAISFPALVKEILSSPCDGAKIRALHCILRLLTMAFEKPSAIKEAFLQDASSLIALLTNEMPSLVWEKTCNLLRDILDYQSTTVSERGSSAENEFVLASQFLQLVNGKLWTVMPHNDGFHGLGGPFITDDINPLSDESYASADKPLIQSFLLCNLACLANLSTHFHDENEEMQDHAKLFHESVIAIQECIEVKICSRQETQRTALNDIQSFCVPVLLLFNDQDDALVQGLLYFLDISKCIKKQDLLKKNSNLYYSGLWNPHIQFYVFLSIVNKDYEVVLDLLISEETCFLLYFLKYLKLIESDWDFLVESHTLGQYDLSLFDREAVYLKRPIHLTCSELSPRLKIRNKETEEVKLHKLVDYDLSSEDSDAEENSVIPNLPISVKQHSNDAKAESLADSFHSRLKPKNTLLEVILVFNCLLNTIEKQLDKNLFPYNAKPLLRLLKAIKNNYQ